VAVIKPISWNLAWVKFHFKPLKPFGLQLFFNGGVHQNVDYSFLTLSVNSQHQQSDFQEKSTSTKNCENQQSKT
jgi:hypothetical protein